ncbi:hypothetical protein MAR_030479, partial [Mya arenaria]
MSVSGVLMNMFTQYGCCDTLVSEKGSRFTATKNRGLQFTPNFVQHCHSICYKANTIHEKSLQQLTYWSIQLCSKYSVFTDLNSVLLVFLHTSFTILECFAKP